MSIEPGEITENRKVKKDHGDGEVALESRPGRYRYYEGRGGKMGCFTCGGRLEKGAIQKEMVEGYITLRL